MYRKNVISSKNKAIGYRSRVNIREKHEFLMVRGIRSILFTTWILRYYKYVKTKKKNDICKHPTLATKYYSEDYIAKEK